MTIIQQVEEEQLIHQMTHVESTLDIYDGDSGPRGSGRRDAAVGHKVIKH